MLGAMETDARRPRGRPGRPAGSPPNREASLAAAREQFVLSGYESATIRGIAAAAGVDPALVHHYFGSKDRLFQAAIQLPLNPREIVIGLLADGPDGLGRRLLERFFDAWEGEPQAMGGALAGMLRSAADHEGAATMLREFVTNEVLEPIARALDVPQPRLRAALVASQVFGLAMARFVLCLDPIADASRETLIAVCAPTLQRYLTEPL
jgi:AcrR family transcriptional regulator